MSATVIKNHNIVEPIKTKTLDDISKEDDGKDKKPSWVNIVVYSPRSPRVFKLEKKC